MTRPGHTRLPRHRIPRKDFVYVGRPDRYLSTEVPAVISIPLPHKFDSPRFKEIAHPSPRVWMHHIELSEIEQVDPELAAWLGTAFATAEQWFPNDESG